MARIAPDGPPPVSRSLSRSDASLHHVDDRDDRHLTTNNSMERQRKREDMGMGTSDIFRAAEFDDVVTFRACLAAGATLGNTEGYYMWTVGHWAASANCANILAVIVDHVPSPPELTRLFMLRSWLMQTVAHTAAMQGHLETIRLLLQLELDGRIDGRIWDATDIFGRTCMDLAISQNEGDPAQLLVLREFYLLLPDTSTSRFVVETKVRLTEAMRVMDPTNGVAGLNPKLVWMVVRGCADDGYNILSILVAMYAVVDRASLFPVLHSYISALIEQLMDSCRTKAHTKALLAPLVGETRTLKQPVDAISFCVRSGNKRFIAHPKVQAVMTEKFDPMGSYEYSANPATFLFWCLSALFVYTWYLLVWIPLLALRPFSDHLTHWSLKGRAVVDTRFPWHIPYNKWLASYLTFVIFLVLLSLVALDQSGTLSWKHIAIAIWAVSTLVDGAQDALDVGSYTFAFRHASGVCYLVYFACLCVVLHHDTPSTLVMFHANDALALSIMCVYVQMLGVWDISPSIGPLLVTIRKTVLLDVTRFLAISCVLFLGFTFAMFAVFKPLCSDTCTAYDAGWVTNWQDRGLASALMTLQFQLFGQGSPESWLQKEASSAIFYTVFTFTSSVLLINLFIAMLSDTYSGVKAAANMEYMFIRARIIFDFGAQEPIYPPLNLIHLAFGSVGNGLRRLAFGPGNFTPVVLSHTSAVDSRMLFKWYLPTGVPGEQAMVLRRQTIAAFVVAVERQGREETAHGNVGWLSEARSNL